MRTYTGRTVGSHSTSTNKIKGTGFYPFFIVILALICIVFFSFSTCAKSDTDVSEYCMDTQEQILILPEDATWAEWNADKRVEWAQLVADSEAEHFGIEPLTVRSRELDDNTAGCYSHSSRTITLNSKYLASANWKDIIKVVCHEAHHSYAHHLVKLYDDTAEGQKDLLIFEKIAVYKSEFENYNDGTSDFYEYAAQNVEIDANTYAEARTFEYCLHTPLEWCVSRDQGQ